MENFLTNEMAIILIIILVTVMVGIIFLLISSKQFHIRNVDVELEDFLNHLYVASTQSSKEAQGAVESFTSQLKNYEGQQAKTKEGLNNFVQHIMGKMDSMEERIGSIQELALEKEIKIRRYEDGYDQVKIKNFTKGLFNILESIKEERNKEDHEGLAEVEEDILILLENNGIEQTRVEVGSNFKDFSKVAKVVTTEETNDISKDSIIKEVRKDGYFIQVDENTTKVLIPAEIVIYKLNLGVENV